MRGRITPEKVTELSMCEIFVFGSNLAGQHHGGAARTAHQKFGAEWGVGVGRTGRTYAIPTMHGGITDIKPYVDQFIEYAKEHPDNRFLVTRIGCGIAGFTDEEMAPLFREAWKLPNVCLPADWVLTLDSDGMLDAIPEKPNVIVPKAIDENDLTRLCNEYKYIIGARIMAAPKPDIWIRYVIGRDRFGYARFGDFFFFEFDDGSRHLYVWTRNKEFADSHNQDIVEGYFGDECEGRGYCHRAIFAGVETPYKDSNGKSIYTGDVIDVNDGEMKLAFGTLGNNFYNPSSLNAIYAFKLDNHLLTPEECRKMTRIGTVFFRLDWGDETTVADRCWHFNTDCISDKDIDVLTKYTPNFDKELWKYHANEILGIEFNSI